MSPSIQKSQMPQPPYTAAMMSASTLFVIITTTLTLCQANLVPKQPPRNCTQPGPLCETCTNVVTCIQNSDGTWTKNNIGTCSDLTEKCFNGSCTTEYEPICDGTADFKFPCQKVGIFPHPFYCNKFVLCVDKGLTKLEPYVNECSDGYGYNAGTSSCDLQLEGGQCAEGEYPVPPCHYIGQSGAVDENQSIYYTCEQYSKLNDVLYPVLDRCPHGQVYQDYGCHENESTVGGTETTTG